MGMVYPGQTTTSKQERNGLASLVDGRLERYSSDRSSWESEWRLDYDSWQRVYSEKWKAMEGVDWRSNIFVGITDLKVRTIVATLNDALGQKFPFDVQPTPEPDQMPGSYQIKPDEMAWRSRNMRRLIEDQLVEMRADRELKSAILELVVYGNVVIKCPILVPYKRRRYMTELQGAIDGQPYYSFNRKVTQGHRLAFRHIDLFSFFCDADATSPQEGEGCVHKQLFSAGEFLRYTKSSRGFIPEEIKRVLEELTKDGRISTTTDEGPTKDDVTRRRPIEVKEYWGLVTRREIEEGGGDFEIILDEYRKFDPEQLDDYEELEVVLVVANGHLIKVAPNYLDGQRPFLLGRYDIVPNRIFGWGVPKRMRDAQAMLNSSVRGFIDNMAVSANVMGAMDPEAFMPGTSNRFAPGEMKLMKKGADSGKALKAIVFPNIGASLLPMIELFERYASEQSVPNLLSGQSEQSQPKTAFGLSKLWEGSHKQMTEPLRNIDDDLIEPIVTEFYHWNMSDPTVPDQYKGDCQCQATGYSSFQDKTVKGERIRFLLQLALDSQVMGAAIKILPLVKDLVKTLDEDPDLRVASEEEFNDKMMEMQQASIQAASLKASPKPSRPTGMNRAA